MNKHSNSYSIWKKHGKPDKPSIEQIKAIRDRAGLELYEQVKDLRIKKDLEYIVDMPMHSVSLLLFVPESEKAPTPTAFIKSEVERGYNDNQQVFLKWDPNQEDLLFESES